MMRVNSIQFNNNYKPISFKNAKENDTAINIQYPDTTKFQNNTELVAAEHDAYLVKPLRALWNKFIQAARSFRSGTIEALDPQDYDALALYSNPF